MKLGYELRSTSKKGEGVFATRSFNIGDIVMVGVFKILSTQNHSHASQIGENDYAFHDGLITKVNHSCDPNCGIQINATGAHDFIAFKKISINEETTFDYAMRNYNVDFFPKQCMCGSKRCLGNITGWKNLPNERKKEYKNYAAPYLIALDAKHENLSKVL
ncbi:MAG: SET domain-containing protein-lysine N-methyltransferase [Leptospirales bacterium]